MSEFLNAYPISGRKTRKIHSVQRIPMGESTGLEYKEFISGKLGMREVSYILRDESPLYLNNWISFKNAGLPVVPSLRIDDNRNILVTDVKADGSEVYGKGMDYLLTYSVADRFRPNPLCDEKFLSLTDPSSFAQVKEAVRDLVVNANTNCITLPHDDPCELVISPKGTWKLMILDLRYGVSYNPNTITEHEMLAMRRTNTNETWHFLNHLQNIRALLLPQEKPRRNFRSFLNKKS